MANTKLNSEDFIQLLTNCHNNNNNNNNNNINENDCDVIAKDDRIDKQECTENSEKFLQAWNRLLIGNLLSKVDLRLYDKTSSDAFITSDRNSEKSLSFKEFELLKNIPVNIRQSAFFQELNKKMETFVSENEKSSTCAKSYGFDRKTDTLVSAFSNDTTLESFFLTETISGSTNLPAKLDHLKNVEHLSTTPLNNNNTKCGNRVAGKFGNGLVNIAYLLLNDKNVFYRKIGCDMDKATLFETESASTSMLETLDFNKTVGEQLDTYETNTVDTTNSCDRIDMKDEEFISEEMAKSGETGIAGEEYNSDKDDIFSNKLSTVSEYIYRGDKCNREIKYNWKRKSLVIHPSIESLPVKTSHKIMKNTIHIRKTKRLQNTKILKRKFRTNVQCKRKKHKLTNNSAELLINKSKQEIMVDAKKYSISEPQLKKTNWINAQVSVGCGCSNGICYAPSENSLPPNLFDKMGTIAYNTTNFTEKGTAELNNPLKLSYTNDFVKNVNLNGIDNIYVTVPIDIDKYECADLKSRITTFKNKVIKGIPVFPVNKDFRQFRNLQQMEEEVFEDISKNDEDEQVNVDGKNKGFNHNPLTNYLEETKEEISYCTHVKNSESGFCGNKHGIGTRKSGSQKLHELLLNNIHRSVSIKVKRYRKAFITVDRNESVLLNTGGNNDFNRADDKFEGILDFTIGKMKEEYLNKNICEENVKKCVEENLIGKLDVVNIDEGVNLNENCGEQVMSEISTNNDGCGVNDVDCSVTFNKSKPTLQVSASDSNMEYLMPSTSSAYLQTQSLIRQEIPNEDFKMWSAQQELYHPEQQQSETVLMNNENKSDDILLSSSIRIDDDNKFRIYSQSGSNNEKSVNVENLDEINMAQSHFYNRNKKMFNNNINRKWTPSQNSTSEKTSIDLTKEKIKRKTTLNRKQHIVGGPSTFTTEKMTNCEDFHSGNNDNKNNKRHHPVKNIKFKLLNDKIMIIKTTDDDNLSQTFQLPKKRSFWGSMLKQTARFMPFFTYHGTKINLDALGDSLAR